MTRKIPSTTMYRFIGTFTHTPDFDIVPGYLYQITLTKNDGYYGQEFDIVAHITILSPEDLRTCLYWALPYSDIDAFDQDWKEYNG